MRWGRLFRADSVHLLTETDVLHARDELGIRTLLDLRSEMEITVGGTGALADVAAMRHHLPLTSRNHHPIDAPTAATDAADRSPAAMFAQYVGILEGTSDLVVSGVSALASSDALPAVFFCAAGKDRTGVLSAVVLGALGVRDEDIVEDYVLTGESIEHIIGRFGATPGAPAMYRDLPPSHFAPYAETMERVIAYIGDSYGSWTGYLDTKGLPRDALDALAGSLLTAEE